MSDTGERVYMVKDAAGQWRGASYEEWIEAFNSGRPVAAGTIVAEPPAGPGVDVSGWDEIGAIKQ